MTLYLDIRLLRKGWKRHPLFSFFKKIKIQRTARPEVFTEGYAQNKPLIRKLNIQISKCNSQISGKSFVYDSCVEF